MSNLCPIVVSAPLGEPSAWFPSLDMDGSDLWMVPASDLSLELVVEDLFLGRKTLLNKEMSGKCSETEILQR